MNEEIRERIADLLKGNVNLYKDKKRGLTVSFSASLPHQILSDPDIKEGLELLERYRAGELVKKEVE